MSANLDDCAEQLRTEGAFVWETMHPSERRLMFVVVRVDAKGLSLFETDADFSLLEKQDLDALQKVLKENVGSFSVVMRRAFDDRACLRCKSKKWPLGSDQRCTGKWGCGLREQGALPL